jgi:hypothetical protein
MGETGRKDGEKVEEEAKKVGNKLRPGSDRQLGELYFGIWGRQA